MKRTESVEVGTRPLLDVARAARRAAALREASAEFRRTGVAGADLPAIARGVGLTRSSLYNYCAGREDLARQCYLESLAALESVLAATQGMPGSGLARVIAFVREATGHDRPIAAIAAELDLLPEDARAEIEREQVRAFDALAALILSGQQDGSIRACDPAIAARTIWGLVSWTPLGAMWAGPIGEDLSARMEMALPDLIERGIVSDGWRHQRGVVPADLLASIWSARPDDRVEEIGRTASSLFNRRGIEGVSLEDVAAAMGATKGLVYHHFESKAALVRHCFERGFAIYDRILDIAGAAPDGLEQTRRAIALNAQAQLHALHPMSPNAFYKRLSSADQAHFSEKSAALLERSILIVECGTADGLKRAVDAPAVALAAAGSFLFLGKWIPANTRDPLTVAHEVSDLFLYGLCAPS